MNQLNKVQPEDISRLDSNQLVNLLSILLHAEARSRVLGRHGIHVPLQISVPDGGSDGTWNAAIDEYEYIPRSLTYYQCKAQALTPTSCSREVLQKSRNGRLGLKEKVSEVLQHSGAYVFFSSKPCVRIDRSIAAVRKALQAGGRKKAAQTDCVDILDANRIAAWVNLHTAAFTYVTHCATNWQAVGLRTISDWSGDPIFRYPFQPNDYLNEQISGLREWLMPLQRIARITGPSGLGKTRLGYEVFAYDLDQSSHIRRALTASAAYVDVQLYPLDVLGWVDQLCTLGFQGIVVVDNCPHEYHYKLAAIVRRTSSQLSLLTLDYVPESLNQDCLHVSLDPERLSDIIPKILKATTALAHLQEAEIEHIARFAQGFPQMAILMAQAGKALDYRSLNNEGNIADRLLWGRKQPNQEAREIIRALALFSAVGISGNVKHQLEFVRDKLCGGITEFKYNSLVRQFEEMRILQKAGDYMLVTPAPLAVALAAEWLGDVPDGHFQDLLSGFNANGLTRPFCEQLRKLDFSEKAVALTERLIGPNGPFSSAEVLNSTAGSQIFRALSELNPVVATDCLYRLFGDSDPEKAHNLDKGRREIVWSLEKLCWSATDFHRAATVLLKLAAGENEHWANNATAQFIQLFHIYLSGTQCPAVERLALLRRGIQSPHRAEQELCIRALGSALEYQHFSRSSGPETRGTRMPEKDWEPILYSDVWEYWRQAFRLLQDQIVAGGEIAAAAADTLGSSLGSILTCPLINELEQDFKVLASHLGGLWPSARETIKHQLQYSRDLSQKTRSDMERWLSYVQPRDLRNRLIDIVSTPGWHHQEKGKGEFEDLSEKKAIAFAEELYQGTIDWTPFLHDLLQGTQHQAWSFGRRWAEITTNPIDLIKKGLRVLRDIPKDRANPQLLRGMLSTIQNDDETAEVLELVAKDDLLRDHLVPLTTAACKSLNDFDRVAKQVESGRLAADCLRNFAYGAVTAKFDDAAFCARLQQLIERASQSQPAILEILDMHFHRRSERKAAYRALLESITVSKEILEASGNTREAYIWEQTVRYLLASGPSENWLAKLSDRLVNQLTHGSGWGYQDDFHAIIGLLLSQHSSVAWPFFERQLADRENRYRLIHALGRSGAHFDGSGSALWNLPSDEFRLWAEANRDLIPMILHFMSLYTAEADQNGKECYRWHPHALVLLNLGEIENIQSSFIGNLFSFSSTGSRVPYLEKRIALVEDLLDTTSDGLRRMAEAALECLKQEKAKEQKRDAEHSVGIF